jgi:hypothetical protein
MTNISDGKEKRRQRSVIANNSDGKDSKIAKCPNRKVDEIVKWKNHEGGRNHEAAKS